MESIILEHVQLVNQLEINYKSHIDKLLDQKAVILSQLHKMFYDKLIQLKNSQMQTAMHNAQPKMIQINHTNNESNMNHNHNIKIQENMDLESHKNGDSKMSENQAQINPNHIENNPKNATLNLPKLNSHFTNKRIADINNSISAIKSEQNIENNTNSNSHNSNNESHNSYHTINANIKKESNENDEITNIAHLLLAMNQSHTAQSQSQTQNPSQNVASHQYTNNNGSKGMQMQNQNNFFLQHVIDVISNENNSAKTQTNSNNSNPKNDELLIESDNNDMITKTKDSDGVVWHLCHMCDYKSKYSGNLSRHIRQHLRKNSSDKDLDNDNDNDNSESESESSNSSTAMESSVSSSLHIPVSRSKITTVYQCYLCDRQFDERQRLLDHQEQHQKHDSHSTRANGGVGSGNEQSTDDLHKPYKCPYDNCKKRFKVKQGLKGHIKNIHTPEDEKKFKCNECGKKFGQKGVLVFHQKNIHQSEKKWKCDVCSRKFRLKSEWKRHSKIHI